MAPSDDSPLEHCFSFLVSSELSGPLFHCPGARACGPGHSFLTLGYLYFQLQLELAAVKGLLKAWPGFPAWPRAALPAAADPLPGQRPPRPAVLIFLVYSGYGTQVGRSALSLFWKVVLRASRELWGLPNPEVQQRLVYRK